MDPADNPLAMDAYLEFMVGVDNALMRERIQNAGYSTLRSLVKKDPKTHGSKVANVVRKSTGGVAANRDVSVTVEEYLIDLVILTRFLYMVDRELDFNWADLDALEEVGYWWLRR